MESKKEQFIEDVRQKMVSALCVSYESTEDVDTEVKAVAALAALVEWEEVKDRCKGV